MGQTDTGGKQLKSGARAKQAGLLLRLNDTTLESICGKGAATLAQKACSPDMVARAC